MMLWILYILCACSCCCCGEPQQDAELRITPQSAITGDRVQIECRNNRKDSVAVYFSLMRVSPTDRWTELARLEVLCVNSIVIRQTYGLGTGSLRPANCDAMIAADVIARRDTLAGQYRCQVQYVMPDFSQSRATSQPADLTVGDRTPGVTRFDLVNTATGEAIGANGTVASGTNATVTCETDPVDPPVEFTVKITDRQPRVASPPAGTNRVVFYDIVPKVPRVVYHCSAFNGFGEPQSKEFVVTVVSVTKPSIATKIYSALVRWKSWWQF